MLKLLIPLALCLGLNAQVVITRTVTIEDFFKAVATVESNNNDEAVGDNGNSIGRYQIQKAYWKDAVDHDTTLKQGRVWKDVKDPKYAEQVMLAYFDKYAKEELKAKNWEHLARLHNGGPGVFKRSQDSKAYKATTVYWSKVEKLMPKTKEVK